MADVSIEVGFGSDRGQLLLIAALAVAVILVGVALLLNAAIFTENVATRETGADGREAIDIRGSTVADIGELIERENERENEPDVTDRVGDGIDAIVPLLEREHIRHGIVVDLERQGIDEGERIEWDTDVRSENFTVEREEEDEEGNTILVDEPEWTLLTEVNATRGFTLTIDRTTLESLDEPNETQLQDEAFGIEFAGEDITQFIYADQDSGDIVVAQVSGGSVDHRCSIASADEVTVDLTGDRLTTDEEMTRCHRGLWPTTDFEQIDTIEITNGDSAGGEFSLTIDDESAAASEDELTNEPAVYAATVDFRYTSAELDFETHIEVAPGEPR